MPSSPAAPTPPQERKRCEDAQREAAVAASRAAEACARAERLGGEAGELAAALEQRQELVAALRAESDAWSAKLMGHREYHEREMEGLRRALREEHEAQASERAAAGAACRPPVTAASSGQPCQRTHPPACCPHRLN